MISIKHICSYLFNSILKFRKLNKKFIEYGCVTPDESEHKKNKQNKTE
tara:strand:- start:160 stop:303 length:144 start_codon:yes stop_codon:yes gene_type:complete